LNIEDSLQEFSSNHRNRNEENKEWKIHSNNAWKTLEISTEKNDHKDYMVFEKKNIEKSSSGTTLYQYLEMEDGSLIRLGNFVKVSESDNEHDATTTSSNPSNINEEDKAELDYDDDEIEDASGTEDGYEYVEDSNEFIDLYEDEYSYYSTTTSVATTAETEGSGSVSPWFVDLVSTI